MIVSPVAHRSSRVREVVRSSSSTSAAVPSSASQNSPVQRSTNVASYAWRSALSEATAVFMFVSRSIPACPAGHPEMVVRGVAAMNQHATGTVRG